MSEWWCVKDGQRHGPISSDDIKKLLLVGDVSPRTRVWRKGMEGWMPLSGVAEFQVLVSEFPPSIDDDELSEPSLLDTDERVVLPSTVPAGRWSRFYARNIDLLVFSYLGWVSLVIAFPAVRTLDNHPFMVSFLSFPMALLIETPVMTFLGTTFGKAIFGIAVRNLDGSRLSFGQLFRRNLILWGYGLGLGIPLLNLYYLAKSYRSAKDGRRSSWDEIPMHNVRQASIGGLRWAAGFVVFLGLTVWLVVLESEPVHQTAAAASPSYTWVNPYTGDTAIIPSGWRQNAKQERTNPGVWWFENTKSIVVLARETFPDVDLARYVEVLRNANDYGVLESQTIETDANGLAVHVLRHHKSTQGWTYRVEARVWKISMNDYWRLITFTPAENAQEWTAANDLGRVLANTSLVPIKPTEASIPL